jgi:hypothetical protein
MDNFSIRTGYTKVSDGETLNMSELNLEMLRRQNEAQLQKIKQLDNDKRKLDGEELIKMIAHQNS